MVYLWVLKRRSLINWQGFWQFGIRKSLVYIISVFHNCQRAVFSGYFKFLDIDILDPFMSVSLGFVFQYLTLYYFFVLFWWPTLIEG